MEVTNISVNARFDRLQQLLLAMRTGNKLRPDEAANLTGLSEGVCRAALERLERAGLMARPAKDLFVRCTLDVRS